jgi:8-hydroxy-5-deazaflavin:NADPH oxidoreductase
VSGLAPLCETSDAHRHSRLRVDGRQAWDVFARAGHEVVFSYARGSQKLKRLARDASGTARPGTPREAAGRADTLLLAVHWSRIDAVLGQAGDFSGKVVITCSLPMNGDNTALVVAHTSSGAEELASKVLQPHVVSAFNTLPSEVLFGVFYAARQKATRPSLVYCGDDEHAKKLTADLTKDVEFDPVDTGSLRIARYTEPFALLIGEIAYGGKAGPELAYRFERFAEA